MAKSRSKSTLTKVIEKSDCPIYLIDGQQTLVYGNQAFFDWIGCEETVPLEKDSLIGTRLIYSSSSELSDAQRQLCGLAPPPDLAAAGHPFTAMVTRQKREQQKTETASAHFSFVENVQDESSASCLMAVVSLLRPQSTADAVTASLKQSPTDPIEKLHAALKELADSLPDWELNSALIGTSEYVVRLRKQVKAAALHGMEFTILGPAGSGRETLARLIMQQRTDVGRTTGFNHELVTLHGYVADRELIQSCFDQAIEQSKETAIENSSRTDRVQPWLLILDADQLDGASQTELWSLLQNNTSRLKLVATAEKDLMKCVDEDGFHKGLAHLLTTQTIETIALSEHLTDLPLLIQHELEQLNVNREVQLGRLSTAAMKMINEFHWPGNLTELKSIISAAADRCNGHEIDVDDLPEKFRFQIAALKSPASEIVQIDLEKYLAEIELQLVSRALQMSKGNKTKASKLLGISRAKLLRRIQHFELNNAPTEGEQASGKTDSPDLSADDFRPLDEPIFEEADD